jgi:hypothetical protein
MQVATEISPPIASRLARLEERIEKALTAAEHSVAVYLAMREFEAKGSVHDA